MQRETSTGPVTDVHSVLLRARILSGAMIGGVVTFAVVACALIAAGALPEGPSLRLTGTVLLGLFTAAVALVLAAPFVGQAAARSAPGGSGEQRAREFMTETVVTQAIREGAGLVGIAIAMLAGDVSWVLAFAFLSVVGQAWSWPREESLRKRLRLL